MEANFNFKKLASALLYKLNNKKFRSNETRAVYKDGTPAKTVNIPMVFEKYDISDGYCPIITYREINWRKAIGEILWIYQDQSNDISVLEEKYGIKWWGVS